MKNKDLQPRLLYPARLSLKMEGKIKNFPDKKNANRVHIHQASIVRDATETAIKWRRERHTHRQTETETLNYTLHRTDLIDIYRTSHPKEAKYTFFSNAHRTF